MTTVDFLDYFLIKERLMDMSRAESYKQALKGDLDEQLISDIYLARKMIYQNCKMAKSVTDLYDILDDLKSNIPAHPVTFNQQEFANAWLMTIKDIKSSFLK